MTKNTFRQYRVLGKGGFGEVSDQHFLCIRVPSSHHCPLADSDLGWPSGQHEQVLLAGGGCAGRCYAVGIA